MSSAHISHRWPRGWPGEGCRGSCPTRGGFAAAGTRVGRAARVRAGCKGRCPPLEMRPVRGGARPAIMASRVDFPPPDRPVSATMRPGGISRSTGAISGRDPPGAATVTPRSVRPDSRPDGGAPFGKSWAEPMTGAIRGGRIAHPADLGHATVERPPEPRPWTSAAKDGDGCQRRRQHPPRPPSRRPPPMLRPPPAAHCPRPARWPADKGGGGAKPPRSAPRAAASWGQPRGCAEPEGHQQRPAPCGRRQSVRCWPCEGPDAQASASAAGAMAARPATKHGQRAARKQNAHDPACKTGAHQPVPAAPPPGPTSMRLPSSGKISRIAMPSSASTSPVTPVEHRGAAQTGEPHRHPAGQDRTAPHPQPRQRAQKRRVMSQHPLAIARRRPPQCQKPHPPAEGRRKDVEGDAKPGQPRCARSGDETSPNRPSSAAPATKHRDRTASGRADSAARSSAQIRRAMRHSGLMPRPSIPGPPNTSADPSRRPAPGRARHDQRRAARL